MTATAGASQRGQALAQEQEGRLQGPRGVRHLLLHDVHEAAPALRARRPGREASHRAELIHSGLHYAPESVLT